MFYVYGYFLPDCDEPFYIGKGQGDRSHEHLEQANLEKPDAFHRYLKRLLSQRISPRIEILWDGLEESDAFEYEKDAIQTYGRKCDGTGCLLNMTLGGDGVSGYKHTEETIQKIKEARARQSPLDEFQRQQFSQRMKGNQYARGAIHSLDQNLQKSFRQLGRIVSERHSHTESTKDQISHSLREAYSSGKRHSSKKPIIALKDGLIVRRFDCLLDAQREGYHNAGLVANGKRTRAYGFDWRWE